MKGKPYSGPNDLKEEGDGDREVGRRAQIKQVSRHVVIWISTCVLYYGGIVVVVLWYGMVWYGVSCCGLCGLLLLLLPLRYTYHQPKCS